MESFNFKNRFITFENKDVRVFAPMDPQEGNHYIEPVKDEVVRSWDHAYNISKDYIHPTVTGKLGWWSASSTSLDSNDALEN